MVRSGLTSRSPFPAMLARLGMIAAVVGTLVGMPQAAALVHPSAKTTVTGR